MKRQYWMLAASLAMALVGSTVAMAATAENPAAAAGGDEMTKVIRTVGVAIAAAFVVGVSIVGAGIAVGRIGSAAIGAAAEKPELFFKSLVYVALAEGLAILGFALAIVLLFSK